MFPIPCNAQTFLLFLKVVNPAPLACLNNSPPPSPPPPPPSLSSHTSALLLLFVAVAPLCSVWRITSDLCRTNTAQTVILSSMLQIWQVPWCAVPTQFHAQQRCMPVLISCAVFLQLIIDPVCMLTCCPKLLHSFVYKVPHLGVQLLTPLGLMDIARYVCSRDLIIAEVLTQLSLNLVAAAHAHDMF